MRAPLALLALLLAATPAAASSVPRVDLPAYGSSVALGFYDLNFDHACGDRLAIGVNTNLVSIAARLTYRLGGEPGGFCWGLGLAAGPGAFPDSSLVNPGLDLGPVPTDTLGSGFFQPALVWSVPAGERLTVRGTLGPVLFSRLRKHGDYRYIESLLAPLWPNVELAYRYDWGELTLGGGLFGVRLSY